MTDESADERRKAIKETQEKCTETVNRAMLSLLAVGFFCLLTTFGATDLALSGLLRVGEEKSIKVPLVEAPVSFGGFLVVAPLLLIILTLYLHLFYGYWLDLEKARRTQGVPQTYPVLFGMDHWVARILTSVTFYWLVPAILACITWKALVRLE